MRKFNSVCVLGLGYIGLPTASLLGTKGYNVIGVDISQDVVDTINRGEIHIVEPDLDLLVKSAVNSGKLEASTQPSPADIFIIAVPTPFKDNHQPDLTYIESATTAIAPYLKPGNLVILESTSPVGTTENVVANILQDKGFDIINDIHIAHCPERVLPGRILIELIQNDRIVGGISQAATAMAASFYEEFVNGEVLRTNAKTAEMSKLTENSFRDVNIAFANELSMICDQEQIDVWELISLANRHPRVDVLKPGPGVGGHCIAVDPWFIIDKAGDKAKLIRSAREVNESKPQWVIDKITERARKFRRPVIACLGLAFKADVDDLRESPAHEIVSTLIEKNIADLLICEPNIKSHPNFELTHHNEAIEKADIILVLVDHKEFKTIRPTIFIEKMVIDACGITK
ncbi:UDP-N-acetyl-D-mannosamine dehydrogenase [Gammaproteobacteria bacterium 45_16_T64]|nr:UDP-N-acetyl-D-mannosamine dehydrogenase [Gammaproteobacteria bacterium 45_16_T64]